MYSASLFNLCSYIYVHTVSSTLLSHWTTGLRALQGVIVSAISLYKNTYNDAT